MGGTKIVVVHIREIIKTAAFAAAGIALIVLLVYLFLPRQAQESVSGLYVPGTYTSEIILQDEPVNIEITVSESEIVSVELKDMDEVQEVFYPTLMPTMQTLADEIVRLQTAEINLSEEYPVTSQVLLGAVQTAIDKARTEIE